MSSSSDDSKSSSSMKYPLMIAGAIALVAAVAVGAGMLHHEHEEHERNEIRHVIKHEQKEDEERKHRAPSHPQFNVQKLETGMRLGLIGGELEMPYFVVAQQDLQIQPVNNTSLPYLAIPGQVIKPELLPTISLPVGGIDSQTYSSTIVSAVSSNVSAAAITGSITGNVLTVTGLGVGDELGINQVISGTGVVPGTIIISFGTGTGGNGTYNLSYTYPAPIAAGPFTANSAAKITFTMTTAPIFGNNVAMTVLGFTGADSAVFNGAYSKAIVSGSVIKTYPPIRVWPSQTAALTAGITSGTMVVQLPTSGNFFEEELWLCDADTYISAGGATAGSYPQTMELKLKIASFTAGANFLGSISGSPATLTVTDVTAGTISVGSPVQNLNSALGFGIATTVSGAQTIPFGSFTLNVASTTNFNPAGGSFTVNSTSVAGSVAYGPISITYTGVTATSFTGCVCNDIYAVGITLPIANGAAVVAVATVQSQVTPLIAGETLGGIGRYILNLSPIGGTQPSSSMYQQASMTPVCPSYYNVPNWPPQITNTNAAFGTPVMYTLKRVRLSAMPYGCWVGSMDNQGNAIVKTQCVFNFKKVSLFWLMVFEQSLSDDGSWNFVKDPQFADGLPNLRTGDSTSHIITWNLKGLNAGSKYTVIPVIPSPRLVNFINEGIDPTSFGFQNEMRSSNTCVGSFNTTFRMPYPKSYKDDIRFVLGSCNADGTNSTLGLAYQRSMETEYDALIHLGDHVYGDQGGSSLLNFNFPNNAATTLGFVSGQAYNLQTNYLGGPSGYPNSTANINVPSLLTAPFLITTLPIVISGTNNLFNLNGVTYTIPSASYASLAALIAAIQVLLPSNFVIGTNATGYLTIQQLLWTSWGYNELYTEQRRGIDTVRFNSTCGGYHVSDDHEVANNYQSSPALQGQNTGSAIQTQISNVMTNNPDAIYQEVTFGTLNLTPGVPSNQIVSDANIDNGLAAYRNQFADSFVSTGLNNGYVQWGSDVELIKLDSAPPKVAGAYSCYASPSVSNPSGAFMRDDQLAFLVDRLTKSSSKVKIVMYSRDLAPIFYTTENVSELRNRYVAIATGLGYNATDAGSTFDLIFKTFENGFSSGYLEWYNNKFMPALVKTGAKNVFFVSGGDHFGYLGRLTSNSKFLNFQLPGLGSNTSGGNTVGTKNGMPANNNGNGKDNVLLYTKRNGFGEVTVSPINNTITFSFVSIDGKDNSVTIPLE